MIIFEKLNFGFIVCNVVFFTIGFMIQEARIAKLKKYNSLYKKIAHAKITEVVKAVQEVEDEDD